MFKSIKAGKIAEDMVAKIMESSGFICKPSPPKTQEFDILCESNSVSFSIEVKYDIMCERTGNIAIEYWNSKSNKPSGINATKATFWCHVIGGSNEVWINTVENVKKILIEKKPLRTICSGGDKNSDMLLYNKDVFCESMFRIDNINQADLIKRLECLMSG